MSARTTKNNGPKRKPLRGPGVIVLIVLASSGALILGVKAARPFILASQLHAENDMLEHRVKQFQLENQRSEREVKSLQTRDGIIRQGREHGFLMPGEQHLHISQSE